MKFIACKNCENIISIKDLNMPYSEDIKNLANQENTIKGEGLCKQCAEEEREKNKPAPLTEEDLIRQQISRFESETGLNRAMREVILTIKSEGYLYEKAQEIEALAAKIREK